MARLSFLTPIVFFCSVRSGSGKATMLVHLAVYLNSMGRKTAIIDLDRDTPLKIKNTIPKSISITEYQDLSSLRETTESRYQKAFFFSENDQIAYFPAQRIEEPGTLFTDTTLRDFILQARSCYDLILINFPSGAENCQNASDLIARRHLWSNNIPACLMISQAEFKCINIVDELLKNSRAMPYQLRENLMLVFNKVPLTVEEQSLLTRHLNPSELKELYDFPHMQIIGNNEEYTYQRNLDNPLVLDNNSLMHQTIATLYRNLGRLGEEATAEAIDPDSFGACLDGALLEKLAPYLDSIHQAVASKLFLPAHQVQVFLEENASTYRIRVRVSDYENSVLGISARIDSFKYSPPLSRDFSFFNSVTRNAAPATVAVAEKQLLPKLTVNPIFRFDDSQLWSTKFSPFGNLPLIPHKERHPSPILFKQNLELQEIPSLSHLLGYLGRRKKYRLFSLSDRPHKNSSLTHFFIPPELSLVYDLDALFQASYAAALNLTRHERIHHVCPIPDLSIFTSGLGYSFNMPDIFARNHSLVFSNFDDNVFWETPTSFFELSTKSFSCTDLTAEFQAISYTADGKYSSQPEISLVIPQSMPLYETRHEEPDFEAENLEIKADVEEQFTTISHSCDFTRSDYPYLESCCHFNVAEFTLSRPLFASASEIMPDFPESFLSYSGLDLEISLRSFNPISGHRSGEVEYYDKLAGEILPDKLKLHSTLLEQQLDSTPLKHLNYQTQIDQSRPQQDYTPDLNISFTVKFLYNQSLYSIESKPNKVSEFAYLFASGKLKLPEKALQIQKRPALAFDVLTVRFKHKKDNSELCSNFDQRYNSNHIADSSISNRQFKLQKRDILSIASPASSRLKSVLAQSKKKFGLRFIAPSLSIDFALSLSLPCLELSDKIKLDRADYSHNFDHTSICQASPAYLLDQHISSAPVATLMPIDATIFVQPILSRSMSLPLFNALAQQLNIFETNSPLRYNAKVNYISNPRSHARYQLRHSHPRPSVDMPYRSKRFGLEPLKNYEDSPQAINDIFKGDYQIRTQHGVPVHGSGLIEHKTDSFNTVKPVLEQQILFNKLFDLGEHIDQRKANFHVHPPYPLDVLYDHLVESSHYHFRRMFDHHILQNHDNAFSTEFAPPSNYQNLRNHYEFSHHVSQVYKRQPMPVKTKQLPIRNIKLRDLLKMARQASQQFTQVQGKISA